MKRVEILHEGEDYFKLLVDGKEIEVGLFEGKVIKHLLQKLKGPCNPNINFNC